MGSLLGLPLGWLVAQQAITRVSDAVSIIYVHVNAKSVQVTANEVVIGMSMGIIGSCFAAFIPASNAARVQPVEALRRDAALGSRTVNVLLQVAMCAILVVATLILIQVGIPRPLGQHLRHAQQRFRIVRI